MSNFEKRVRSARRNSMRKWVRGLKYCGYISMTVVGVLAMMAVVLA